MKRFLEAFAGWLAVLLVGGFFLAGWLFERGYWYRPLFVLALLLAGFTCVLFEQAGELETLKKRLDTLEKAMEKGQEAPPENKPDQEG